MAPHKLLSDVCNYLRAFLLPVSMTTAMTCLAPLKEGGRQTLSFSLRQNAFSPIYSYSLSGKHNTGVPSGSHNKTQPHHFPTIQKTVNSYACRNDMLTPNRITSATLFSKYMNKSQGAIFGICIQKYISQNVLFYVADLKDLRCFELRFVFVIPWEMYGCLTIAITAAPAPARAQMNRWKVMSSCSKNKSQHILLFKHYWTCQPMKIIYVIVLVNVHLILFYIHKHVIMKDL